MKNFTEVLADLTQLKGKELHSISGQATPFVIEEIDEESGRIVLVVQEKRKSRPLQELQDIWSVMMKKPAIHVDSFLSGSGSSRNQPETILANLPYVEWLNVDGKKHIAIVENDTHMYGTIQKMAPEQEKIIAEKVKSYEPTASIQDTEVNEYQEAAAIIHEHTFTTGYDLDVSEDVLQGLYRDFNTKFSPEALSRIPDAELLTSLFYTSESTNDCLCYWLEFNSQIKKYFGSISGGSSFKFGLYQRKEDNVWVSGSPTKPEELSDSDALLLGRSIRDLLIKGAEVIASFDKLDTPEAYEELDDRLNTAIGKYVGFAWIHKYFHMVFPAKFATWHSSEWQRHILLAYGIHPSTKYYARSGQLAIIATYANMSAAFFSGASYDKFGDIKQFIRLGTSDGTTSYFTDWYKDGIAAIGWPDIGHMDAYLQGNDVNRKAISEKLSEIYYPSDNRIASRKAGELAAFYRTNGNSVFVAMNGENLLALGDGVGAYYFVDGQDFPHRKPTTWHTCFSGKEKLPKRSEGILTSCFPLSDDDNLIYLYKKYYYELLNEEAVELEDEEKESVVRTPRVNPLHPLNQIIYGAPGTGKTYSSIEYAMAIVENRPVDMAQKTKAQRQELMQKYSECVSSGHIVFTTFHQSYGYEEFVQGIRPDAKAGAICFKKIDGVFKTIADAAMRDPANNYVIIIDEINRGN